MVSLLGDLPEELIEREKFFRNRQLKKPLINPRGKECKTMNEFWGGPFFEDVSKLEYHVITNHRGQVSGLTCYVLQSEFSIRTLLEGRSWRIP